MSYIFRIRFIFTKLEMEKVVEAIKMNVMMRPKIATPSGLKQKVPESRAPTCLPIGTEFVDRNRLVTLITTIMVYGTYYFALFSAPHSVRVLLPVLGTG